MKRSPNELAGIGYSGLAGVTMDCQGAVLRLLQGGERVSLVRILSCAGSHCLLLTVGVGDLVAIKSGFTSGYDGGGPSGFSRVLQLLDSHGIEIDEYDVEQDVIERVDSSSLTVGDIAALDQARPLRPSRWHEYVSERDRWRARSGELWEEFPPIVPLGIIDPRIVDLAISFWDGPDAKLLTGYRRLEDLVRKRTGIDEHGQKLFSQAFQGTGAKLCWEGLDAGELAGRTALFTGAFMAHRNPRAHQELKDDAGPQLGEFLLLNHLYRLESEAIDRGG